MAVLRLGSTGETPVPPHDASNRPGLGRRARLQRTDAARHLPLSEAGAFFFDVLHALHVEVVGLREPASRVPPHPLARQVPLPVLAAGFLQAVGVPRGPRAVLDSPLVLPFRLFLAVLIPPGELAHRQVAVVLGLDLLVAVAMPGDPGAVLLLLADAGHGRGPGRAVPPVVDRLDHVLGQQVVALIVLLARGVPFDGLRQSAAVEVGDAVDELAFRIPLQQIAIDHAVAVHHLQALLAVGIPPGRLAAADAAIETPFDDLRAALALDDPGA